MKEPFDEELLNSLYSEFNTPEHVKAHCKGVCDTAMAIGKALNYAGYYLDLNVIYSAAMSHDIARIYPNHGEVMAEKLNSLGYHDVASIVKVHMRYNGFKNLSKINEVDIVCLGDCLVKEDKYVGLDERIEYLIDKAGRTLETENRFYSSKAIAKRFIEKIESIVGLGIDDIVIKYSGE